MIGYAAFIAVLILISIYGLFSFGFREFSQIGAQAGLPPDHVYFQFIQMQETTFNRVILTIALVVALLLLFGGLYLSHRIAGPVHRMKKELQKMASENPVTLNPIHFRKNDFFPELAETFNALVEAWKKNP